MLRTTTCTLFKYHTKVAAFGRPLKKAALASTASFVVAFVAALNKAHMLILKAILVLHPHKTKRTLGRMVWERSDTVACIPLA